MNLDNQNLEWKLCEAYFSILETSMTSVVSLDELCKVSKISLDELNKIVSNNSMNNSNFFLKILISKIDREVLNELGLHDLPILAVAKGKKRNAGEEKIYHKNKEFILNKNDSLLFFIQRLRDEAHRFAISTHRAKRKKNLSKSLLDQIQGIGKQRKRALLNHFGSARAVESASLEDLKAIEGIEDSIANKIYNYFHE